MQFVRGESTDSESKGERYTWGASRPGGRGPRGLPAREPSTGGAARRGGAEHDAEDSYWDDDEDAMDEDGNHQTDFPEFLRVPVLVYRRHW